MLKNSMDFPYPVLLTESKNYKKSTIDFKAFIEVKNLDLTLTYNFNINSEFVNKLIDQKLCKPYILVESKHSMYREIFEVTDLKTDIQLTLNIEGIQKKISVTPMVISTSNINHFSSTEFVNNDYEYTINKFDIVGYVETISFYLDNYNTLFQSLANVITVRYNNKQTKSITYSLDDDMIVITLNNSVQFEKLQEINIYNKFTNTIYQSIIFPIVIEALLNMNKVKYEDLRWSRLLQNKLLEQQSSNIKTFQQAFDAAQKLLENPVNKMIDELYVYGGDDE